MRTFILAISLLVMGLLPSLAPSQNAFEDGEWFRFRIHYGLINAGYATLGVEATTLQNKAVYHIKGYGTTTGLSRFFFKVEDHYDSYVDRSDNKPYRFVRKIDEGGHTKDKVIDFDHNLRKAYVNNRKHNTLETFDTRYNTHDMVSAFYYLRNAIDTDQLKVGDESELNMFFDEENFGFKLRFLGRDTINTKFGKVSCLKFRPLVMAGRVFKEKESLTIWVSDDQNKIPLRIKADLAVGSLKADLDAFKGLKHPFEIIY
ncbi:DUF3108 domain-containing protein [Croceiramulus getboli]|nr:DUF3108 domain-containing protein [Flavobacteriaceae bacterium YJPT1-3]